MTNRADKEAWARENVHLNSAEHTGKYSLTWVARLNADGMLFEQRVRGDGRKRESLRQRATDAVVSDYLDYLDSIDRTADS